MVESGTNSAAPALREGVRCTLELAGAVAPLDCLVVEFDEQDVHVAVPALDADGRAALAQVSASAYLVIPGSRGSLHALRAFVIESDRPDALALRLLDRFRLGQRRRAARAALAVPARVEAGAAAAEAVSVDISTGGCRLPSRRRGRRRAPPRRSASRSATPPRCGSRPRSCAPMAWRRASPSRIPARPSAASSRRSCAPTTPRRRPARGPRPRRAAAARGRRSRRPRRGRPTARRRAPAPARSCCASRGRPSPAPPPCPAR